MDSSGAGLGGSSGHEQDCPKDALTSTFHYKTGLIHDFVLKQKLDSGGVSNRYLHDLCMCSEHVRVGSMLYALKQSRCVIYELKLTVVSSDLQSVARRVC